MQVSMEQALVRCAQATAPPVPAEPAEAQPGVPGRSTSPPRPPGSQGSTAGVSTGRPTRAAAWVAHLGDPSRHRVPSELIRAAPSPNGSEAEDCQSRHQQAVTRQTQIGPDSVASFPAVGAVALA
ncbi:MAG: hypothetical protein ACK56F_06500 [bacterium]